MWSTVQATSLGALPGSSRDISSCELSLQSQTKILTCHFEGSRLEHSAGHKPGGTAGVLQPRGVAGCACLFRSPLLPGRLQMRAPQVRNVSLPVLPWLRDCAQRLQ